MRVDSKKSILIFEVYNCSDNYNTRQDKINHRNEINSNLFFLGGDTQNFPL
jgi:hypothetical protein